ncbi:hypothetical protein KSP40_PGU022362 [Platanthera guangdongensis]|uniref:DUF1985 domain-containing protein n=1 Tax=Platanthera guangdongensis TaxID=2320717 RepID=A0ABR2M4J8_9ASPA
MVKKELKHRPHILCTRCVVSTFCSMVQPIVDKLDEKCTSILQHTGILHLFNIPRLPQNIPLLYTLMLLYNGDRNSFKVGSREIKFTVNHVAMILGLPNRGEEVKYSSKPYSDLTKIVLKDKLTEMSKEDYKVEPSNLKNLVLHLLCNFFFPYSGNKISEELLNFADPAEFPKYNWPKAIHGFLKKEFRILSEKANKRPKEELGIRPTETIGYIDGCSHVVLIWILEHTCLTTPMHPNRRPRVHRWSDKISFTLNFCSSLRSEVKFKVLEQFEDITEEEQLLCGIEEEIATISAPLDEETPKEQPSPRQLAPLKKKRSSKDEETSIKKLKYTSPTHPQSFDYSFFLELASNIENKIMSLERTVNDLSLRIVDISNFLRMPSQATVIAPTPLQQCSPPLQIPEPSPTPQ